MKCEQCGIEHDGSYGTGRFCSDHCKRVYCGSRSNVRGKLTGHACHNRNYGYRKVNVPSGPYICQYCGDERKNYNSLINHERLCKSNPNRDVRSYEILMNNLNNGNALYQDGTRVAWNKGLTAATDSRVKQYALTSRHKYMTGELMPSFLGKHHSDDTKTKMRESTLDYIEQTAGGIRYSIKACDYFDKLNRENGWNLVHARNGGEIRVNRFSLDAYDKELNIVVEYDENKHHMCGMDRNPRDIEREKTIKEELGCTFYRYSEFDDELYEV